MYDYINWYQEELWEELVNILKGEHFVVGGKILYRCIAPGAYAMVDRADDNFDEVSTKSFLNDAKVVDPLDWHMKNKERKYLK